MNELSTLRIAFGLAMIALGAAAFGSWQQAGDLIASQAMAKKLEGELAGVRSDLYNLQWANENNGNDTNNQQLMAMSVLQWKLDTCLKDKK